MKNTNSITDRLDNIEKETASKYSSPSLTLVTFNYRIFALFLVIVFSWGLAWPVNKVGLMYMSPLWYTAARLVVGTIAMFVVVLAVKKFSLPEKRDIPLILIIGLLQIGVYILLTNIGLAYLPAGRSSLLAYTTPLWVMPIATLFFNERSGIFKWTGFLLGIAGLITLMNPWEINWTDHNVMLGSSALLLASLCWAISMFCVRHMRWTKSPLELIPWQLLTGAIPILIFAAVKEPALHVHWNTALILSLVYTGILVTGISYWLGVIINKELPTIVVSLGFLIVPVISFMISAIFMHETINVPTAIAITLILVGLGFVVAEK
jgi:drug/metabolite transporter (DMT)-like permease